MPTITPKTLAQFASGIFGGTILGITGFIGLLTYGGNYGCWKFIDYLFNDVGYLSCGSFGAVAGTVIGAILGVVITHKIKISNYKSLTIFLLISAFIVPLIFASGGGSFSYDFDYLTMVISVILTFMAASSVPSLITFLIINRKK